jgi:hypothetical protein
MPPLNQDRLDCARFKIRAFACGLHASKEPGVDRRVLVEAHVIIIHLVTSGLPKRLEHWNTHDSNQERDCCEAQCCEMIMRFSIFVSSFEAVPGRTCKMLTSILAPVLNLMRLQIQIRPKIATSRPGYQVH